VKCREPLRKQMFVKNISSMLSNLVMTHFEVSQAATHVHICEHAQTHMLQDNTYVLSCVASRCAVRAHTHKKSIHKINTRTNTHAHQQYSRRTFAESTRNDRALSQAAAQYERTRTRTKLRHEHAHTNEHTRTQKINAHTQTHAHHKCS